ncbi:MAG: TonB-dependent receptor [Alistipes sp.]|nr:TonB-dependent receptor [Alistipes sp.]
MKRLFTIVAFAAAIFSFDAARAEGGEQILPDSVVDRHLSIDEVGVVVRQPKQHFGLKSQPISSSVISSSMLEREHVLSIKDLSSIVPNFYQPDYGSKMTSSIYVRGFGARIDQPIIGLTVDGVPFLNKNNYDFDMLDVARVELLRGPQSTLYGRNTMGGQMNVYTLSPMNYQGVRATAEYSSGNTFRAKASYYGRTNNGKFGFSVGGFYNRTDGFFTNAYNDSDVDWGESSGGRLRLVGDLGRGWELDNSASFSYDNEGGYAYALYDVEQDIAGDVNYNSPSGYMRYSFSDGLVLSHAGEKVNFSATTTYQFMHDRMRMDNDLTPRSLFTLEQEQHEHAFTEDIVLRSNDKSRRWQWITGAYGFYKKIDMSAPVSLLSDGISELILGNMPAQIKRFLAIDPFTIDSNFDIPTYGLALYHESSLRAGERWRFTAGLRLDYESTKMNYDNMATVNYKFDMTAMSPYIPVLNRSVEVPFTGEEKLDYLELLPKFAINYTTGIGDVYATVTRGYKAGGFNTQIFSDILQNKTKTAMMADAMSQMQGMMGGGGMPGAMPGGAAGGRPSGGDSSSATDSASATTYDPEYSWNYEVGGHFSFDDARLALDVAAFWIECRDQQLTVFPDGLTTGRMMSNAGKSRSRGVEVAATWDALSLMSMSHLRFTANYGYTHAQFEEFNDGVNDYSGNYLPYAPQHTISLGATYDWWIGGRVLDEVVLSASWQGAGKIYWNESNTLHQNFYSQLNASVELRKGDFSLSLWGRNLTNSDFYTFYFKSMNRNFFNCGKPARLGVTLSFAM